MYPTKLTKIINLFESLPEDERRETLVSYADNAKNQEPREREKFDLVDVRKDQECTDTVGVYLHADENGRAHIRMTLGPEVQTLTRSMTAILCKGHEARLRRKLSICPAISCRALWARNWSVSEARRFITSSRVSKVSAKCGSIDSA